MGRPSDFDLLMFHAKIDQMITEHGWYCQAVFPVDDDYQPHFAYTVGLCERGWPELVMIGLPAKASYRYLAELVARYVDERQPFPIGEPIGGLVDGHNLVLIEATADETWTEYAKLAHSRAEVHADGRRALQVVWPDAEGRYPPGWSLAAWMQPLLGAAP
jgi:hypothetical protein